MNFFNNKNIKRNKILFRVIIVSVLLHVVFGFIAGFITIASHLKSEDTSFEVPPVSETEELPKETKVRISPPQPKDLMPRDLKIQQIGNITVDQLDVDLPTMSDDFTVSGGLGGSVSGNLLGGARGNIGLGVSDINVFGLKTRAEKVLFLVDTHRRMLTDEKGGLNSYRVIKDEISFMVSNLSPGTLFNVIFYDHRRFKFFKPKLVPTGVEVSEELSRWFLGINRDAENIGLANIPGVFVPKLGTFEKNDIQEYLEWWNGHNYTAYVTAVALEQDADAIFMITGRHQGIGKIVAPPTEKQLQDWENQKNSEEFKQQLAKYEAEEPEMRRKIQRELEKINADRAKKGQPPRVLKGGGNDVRGNASELGLVWKNPHPPGGPGHRDISPLKVTRYFKDLLERRYTERGVMAPSVNVVLFLAADEVFLDSWQVQLDEYARFFKGKRRIIRGESEIKSARTYQDAL